MVDNGSAAVRYVEAVFRNRVLVLLVAGAIFLGSVAYAALAKKEYASIMRILVQNTRATPLISADRVNPALAGGSAEGIEAQINSEAVLLQSTDLLEGLVRYRDQVLLGQRPPSEGSLQMAQQLEDLQHRLEITAVRKTNLIEVSFKDSDAAAAQRSLRWLSTAFLDKHAELRRPAGTYRFFDTQTKHYEQELETAQSNLIDFQRANDLVSLNQEKSLTLENYNRVMQEIGDAKASQADSKNRLAALTAQLNLESRRITTQVRDTPNQYSAERLNTLLIDLRNKRTQLTMRYQPTDPLVREVDEQIAVTQDALNKTRAQTTVETTSDNNPVHMALDQSLRSTTVETRGTDARTTALSALAHIYNMRLDNLQKLSVENDRLERAVQELKQNRDTYAQKRDEAAIDDELDRSKIVDVSIAQEPTLSWRAVRPARVLTVLLGALAACFVAVACVLFKDAMRETAFTPAELESMLPLPVLATVPERRLPMAAPVLVPNAPPTLLTLRAVQAVAERKQFVHT